MTLASVHKNLCLSAIVMLGSLICHADIGRAQDTTPIAPSLHWPQYRGPDGRGHYRSIEKLPDRLDMDSSLKWKTKIPEGHSSPIVVNDRIFLTGFEKDKLLTLCYDLDTGEQKWRQELKVPILERTHRQHGPATPTAVSDGRRVIVTFGSLGVLAYDLEGNELWRQEREVKRNIFGSASSPIIVDGKLIVFTGNHDESLLQSLDPKTGTVHWQRRRRGPNSSWSTPSVLGSNNKARLLIYEPYHLRCISLTDGQDLWSVPGLADEPITLPAIHNDLVIVTSYNMRLNQEAIGLPTFEELLKSCDTDGDGQINQEESRKNKSVLSRPDADGQGDHPLRMFFRSMDKNNDGQIQADEYPYLQRWVDSFEHANGFIALKTDELNSVPKMAWQQEDGVPECPSPIIIDGKLLAVRNGGVVTCLDVATGKQVFQDRIAPGGPYYSAPVMGDNKIFLASQRGHLSILSAGDQPKLLSKIDLGESIHATPALVTGSIIVRSQNHLWLFRQRTND